MIEDTFVCELKEKEGGRKVNEVYGDAFDTCATRYIIQ